MRSRSYPTPETTGILSGKIWYMDVWLEQALSADGKAAQQRTRSCRISLRKLQANPGEEYMFRERGLGAGAITEIFNNVHQQYKDLTEEQLHDAEFAKKCLPFAGELYMGHLRYSTTGKAVSRMFIHFSAATTGVPRIWHYAVTSI